MSYGSDLTKHSQILHVLCTEVCLDEELETRVLLHCHPKIQLKQKTERSNCLYFC
jgi:hypothetical protein